MPIGPKDIAREQIDRMLEQADWVVQDKKSANLCAKRVIAIGRSNLLPGFGTVDYLLYMV